MPTATVNGVALHYVDRGTGKPVVLLHGFPLDGRMWDAQLADLSAGFRVIVPDLRGFGKSPDDRPFTIEQLADDVRELLKQADALPCVLGGLSMGGYVALAFARKYAADLSGLILFDTRPDADGPEARAGREKNVQLVREKGASAIADAMIPKLLAPGAADRRPEVARPLRQMIEACPPRTIEHALAAMRDRPDRTPELADIKVPTLVVVGDGDQITPPDVARKMQSAIPGAKLVEVKGAGHMSPTEQPTQVNRAVREFVM